LVPTPPESFSGHLVARECSGIYERKAHHQRGFCRSGVHARFKLVEPFTPDDLDRLPTGSLDPGSPLTGFTLKGLNDELSVIHAPPQASVSAYSTSALGRMFGAVAEGSACKPPCPLIALLGALTTSLFALRQNRNLNFLKAPVGNIQPGLCRLSAF
jgi:hypothetical protein